MNFSLRPGFKPNIPSRRLVAAMSVVAIKSSPLNLYIEWKWRNFFIPICHDGGQGNVYILQHLVAMFESDDE